MVVGTCGPSRRITSHPGALRSTRRCREDREAELLHFLFQKLASGFSKHAGEHSNPTVALAEVVPGSFNSGQQIPRHQGWPHWHTAGHPRGRQPGHEADHRQESGAGSHGRKIQTMCPSSRKS